MLKVRRRPAISLLGGLQMPAPKDVVALLLNEITDLPGRMVLVLDDYHVIDDPEIDAALAFLVERMPEQLRLLISTRAEPRLPLPRWRTLQRVSEIGLDDLRFSLDEARLFLKQAMGLEVDLESTQALEARTEGWIAGLQMAALSLQHPVRSESVADVAKRAAEFSGEHHYVIDYLAAEVLRRQPGEIHTFLRQTAMLDRLCAPLCNAVTGRADSKTILARLEQANMFLLRLDDHRHWYRYHRLFADFLRSGVDAAEERRLHLKASAWYEANGFGEEAMKHALAAQDIPATVRLFRALADDALSRAEISKIRAWLDALPDSTIRTHTDLAGYKAGFCTCAVRPRTPRPMPGWRVKTSMPRSLPLAAACWRRYKLTSPSTGANRRRPSSSPGKRWSSSAAALRFFVRMRLACSARHRVWWATAGPRSTPSIKPFGWGRDCPTT